MHIMANTEVTTFLCNLFIFDIVLFYFFLNSAVILLTLRYEHLLQIVD